MSTNQAEQAGAEPVVTYAGFWIRFGALLLDMVIWSSVAIPLLLVFYGAEYFESEEIVQGPTDFLISWVAPVFYSVLFWLRFAATPGKMIVSLKIVSADTGASISTGQAIGRYFAYFLSMLPLGLGFIWVAFDPKKQGWHDKLAGTLVVHKVNNSEADVSSAG